MVVVAVGVVVVVVGVVVIVSIVVLVVRVVSSKSCSFGSRESAREKKRVFAQ